VEGAQLEALVSDLLAAAEAVHPLVEPIVRLVLIAIIIFLGWVILAVPLYIAWVASSPFLLRGHEWGVSLAKKMWAIATANNMDIKKDTAKFVSQHTLHYVFDEAEQILQDFIARAEKQFQSTKENIENGYLKVCESNDELISKTKEILNIRLGENSIVLPEYKIIQQESAIRRKAITKLTVGIILSVAFVAINTMMVNEFFESLVSVRVFGVRVSLILALFFSLLELGLGVLHFLSHEKNTKGSNDLRSNLWEIIIYLIVLILCLIEFFFYAVFSGSMDTSIWSNLFAPNDPPAVLRFWLGPFGFAIVIGLVGMGNLVLSGWNELSESRATIDFQNRLHEVRKLAEVIGQGFVGAREAANKLSNNLSNLGDKMGWIHDQPSPVSDDLENTLAKVEACFDHANDSRRDIYRQLDESEVISIFRKHCLIAISCLIAVFVFVWAQFIFLEHLLPFGSERPALSLLIGISEALILLFAGLATVEKMRMVPGTSPPEFAILQYNPFMKGLGFLMMSAIVGANLLLTVRGGEATEWLWFLFLLACIGFLVWAGRTLQPTIASGWIILNWIAKSIFNVACAVTSALFLGFGIASLFIERVMGVLAYLMVLLSELFRVEIARRPSIEKSQEER
jgi:hypothetical protein